MPNPVISDPKQRVLHKIKQLMGIAEGRRVSSPEEAASAAARAQELLLKHKLDLSDIEDAEAARKEQEIFEEDLTFPKGIREVANWKRILAATICQHHFCKLFTTPRGLRFIGSQEDIAIAAWMYGYLSGQLEGLSARGWEARREQMARSFIESEREALKNKRTGVTWKNSFYVGAVYVLSERFEMMRREVEQAAIRRKRDEERRKAQEAVRNSNGTFSSFSNALMLRLEQAAEEALAPFRQAEQHVEDYIREHYEGRLEEPEKDLSWKEDEDGFHHGFKAGERISLNKPLESKAGARQRIAR